jgi:hypothetical protein
MPDGEAVTAREPSELQRALAALETGCRICGKPPATAENWKHPGGCACETCLSVCWGDYGACVPKDLRSDAARLLRALAADYALVNDTFLASSKMLRPLRYSELTDDFWHQLRAARERWRLP